MLKVNKLSTLEKFELFKKAWFEDGTCIKFKFELLGQEFAYTGKVHHVNGDPQLTFIGGKFVMVKDRNGKIYKNPPISTFMSLRLQFDHFQASINTELGISQSKEIEFSEIDNIEYQLPTR